MIKESINKTVPGNQPVEFIVPHMEAMGLRFVCVVKATVNNPALNDDSRFLDSLRRAVTRWIDETAQGKTAWRQSCQDFNIGDLGNEFPLDEAFVEILAAEGIHQLELESYGGGARNWVHDTHLVNELDLRDECFAEDD